ncbi:unnamed protein product [Larinioides sclopetarius]|uniref:Uncharacterized protein n=1 Tax=Larinioides sclopetarius TaxID=280406 RepID=A0AAV2A5M1_9ARAC
MSDQVGEFENDVPLSVETKPMLTFRITSHEDPRIIETLVNSVDSREHKCKKGRRKSGSKKHRAGRNRKRRYKPYHKLSWAEREKVDERNEKRANRKREYLHSCGLSLAPPNTTQFLFNDSIQGSSLLKKLNNGDHSDASSPSEDDDSSAENDDFLVMWDQRFDGLSRRDLADRFLTLEDEVEEAEKQSVTATKIKIFQDEVRRYEYEIDVLMKLNAKLTKMLKDVSCKDGKIVDKKDEPLEEDISSADIVSTM